MKKRKTDWGLMTLLVMIIIFLGCMVVSMFISQNKHEKEEEEQAKIRQLHEIEIAEFEDVSLKSRYLIIENPHQEQLIVVGEGTDFNIKLSTKQRDTLQIPRNGESQFRKSIDVYIAKEDSSQKIFHLNIRIRGTIPF